MEESCCVVFIPDKVKPHVLKLETVSCETVLSTTIVRLNNALDVCYNVCCGGKIRDSSISHGRMKVDTRIQGFIGSL